MKQDFEIKEYKLPFDFIELPEIKKFKTMPKTEIFAVGTITDALGKEYEIKVRGFGYYDDGNRYGPPENSTPPESWTEIDNSRPVRVYLSGGYYEKHVFDFDHVAQAQMLELLETEGVSVHEND